ncbi:MAG: hypothetical protein HZB38_06860 [Planctomycetes bacterium]|nr:hypothetical protein [Planctomycetota bacterium]
MTVHRGDRSGAVVLKTDGSVATRTPRNTYEADGDLITRVADPLETAIYRKHNSSVKTDFRSLGFSASAATFEIERMVWGEPARLSIPKTFETSRDGDLEKVVAIGESDRTTYWIDSARGDSVVRVRKELPNGQWWESKSELRQFDGIWFPESIVCRSSKFHDGAEPERVIRVLAAEFDAPDHPIELTPADIGMECGMNVLVSEAGKPTQTGRWDGQDVVSDQQYFDRLATGEIRESPRLREAVLRLAQGDSSENPAAPAGAAPTAGVGSGDIMAVAKDVLTKAVGMTLWEDDVSEFIRKYQLDAEQADKATAFLHDAQERAAEYLRRNKAEFAALEQLQAQAGDTQSGRAKYNDKLLTLVRPITEIKERKLMPRLNKLPTRAQRAAAEKPVGAP